MFVIDLSDMKSWLARAADAQWRVLAGCAFMVLAMASIQYDELIAPEVSRVSDGWSTVATDLSRKVASFSL